MSKNCTMKDIVTALLEEFTVEEMEDALLDSRWTEATRILIREEIAKRQEQMKL